MGDTVSRGPRGDGSNVCGSLPQWAAFRRCPPGDHRLYRRRSGAVGRWRTAHAYCGGRLPRRRPDLAHLRLPSVHAPTLLIVGGGDQPVLDLNRRAQQEMTCKTQLTVIPGATHLFEEPGAVERIAELAAG
jgi:pimeloyl-ACP methyl ester carboxylesterase